MIREILHLDIQSLLLPFLILASHLLEKRVLLRLEILIPALIVLNIGLKHNKVSGRSVAL